jgi:hypothetical protein
MHLRDGLVQPSESELRKFFLMPTIAPNTAPLGKNTGAGRSLRVFRQFAWLGVGSVKVAFSRPAPPDRACRDHQRVPFAGCLANANR